MTNKEGKQIVFRRIRGRIVPVEVKKALGGLATMAAGVGVAVGSAYGAGKLFRKGTQLGEKMMRFKATSVSMTGLGHSTAAGAKAAKILERGAIRAGKDSLKAIKASKSVLKYGRMAAAGIVGLGAFNLAKAVAPRLGANKEGEEAFVSYTTGFASSQAALHGFALGFDKRLLKKAVKLGKLIK